MERMEFLTSIAVIVNVICVVLASFIKSQIDRISSDAEWGRSLPFICGWSEGFWLKTVSWKRKWKNGIKEQGEAFWLSSTVLVFLTDGWHLLNFIKNRLDQFPYVFWLAYTFKWIGFLWQLIFIFGLWIISGIVFEFFYSMLPKYIKKK